MSNPQTGLDLALGWPRSHRYAPTCECGADVRRAPIVNLVYTFEVCRCGSPDFDHLVERLWHRKCFVTSEQTLR